MVGGSLQPTVLPPRRGEVRGAAAPAELLPLVVLLLKGDGRRKGAPACRLSAEDVSGGGQRAEARERSSVAQADCSSPEPASAAAPRAIHSAMVAAYPSNRLHALGRLGCDTSSWPGSLLNASAEPPTTSRHRTSLQYPPKALSQELLSTVSPTDETMKLLALHREPRHCPTSAVAAFRHSSSLAVAATRPLASSGENRLT
mmetsp:Transcript_15801/g.44212  ORF Transcript_15801/g.44212 Transcript_15801/m.44212 type:complete len:201 (-) Transcript_15801:653-1255(-)